MISGSEFKSLPGSTRSFLWFTSREVLRVGREDDEAGRRPRTLASLERLVGKLLSEELHDLESSGEKELLQRLLTAARSLTHVITRDLEQLLQTPAWLPETARAPSPQSAPAPANGGRMT